MQDGKLSSLHTLRRFFDSFGITIGVADCRVGIVSNVCQRRWRLGCRYAIRRGGHCGRRHGVRLFPDWGFCERAAVHSAVCHSLDDNCLGRTRPGRSRDGSGGGTGGLFLCPAARVICDRRKGRPLSPRSLSRRRPALHRRRGLARPQETSRARKYSKAGGRNAARERKTLPLAL